MQSQTISGILADLVSVPDVLFVVRSGGVVAEIRSGELAVSCRNDWITVGDNQGPAHMHINHTRISLIKFVEEEKPQRTSYSVQLLDDAHERVLAAFFTKMYDSDMNIVPARLDIYNSIKEKWKGI